MKLDLIKSILESNKLTTINRMSGRNFDLSVSPVEAKRIILNEECKSRYVQVCSTIADQVKVIYERPQCWTRQQKEIIDLLYTKGIIAVPIEPIIKEDNETEEDNKEDNKENNETEKWIGVDLDRTLAKYTEWEGCTSIGDPVEPMVERVKQLIKDGHKIKILTARVSPSNNHEDLNEVISTIKKWCKKHIGQELEITCEKNNRMDIFYDDIAAHIFPNTGIPLIKDVIKIGFVGYSNESKYNESEAKKIIKNIFDKLEKFDQDLQIVSGFTNVGIPKLVYEEAEKRNMYTIGLSAEEAKEYELHDVNAEIIVGKKFGDESEFFINYIDALIKIGGGEQSEKELKMAKDKGYYTENHKL
jgi:hypothetical protein